MILSMQSKKIQDSATIIEPLLLFSAFFLPGYLTQGGNIDRGLFDSVLFNLVYLVTAVSEAGIMLYLIANRGARAEGCSDCGIFREYGLSPLRGIDILRAILILAGILLLVFLFSTALRIIPGNPEFPLNDFAGFTLTKRALIPLVFLTCIATGYREELFFRAYLGTHLEIQGMKPLWVLSSASILFGLGHVYEGVFGFLATTALGFYFGFAFLKRRNIHEIAIAHGLYNFLVLLASLLR